MNLQEETTEMLAYAHTFVENVGKWLDSRNPEDGETKQISV